jgi:hypothetical protein
MLAPAQSLHVLLLRLCRQVLAPPQFARAPLEDAGAPAVLARSSVAVIMADACSPAVLACAPCLRSSRGHYGRCLRPRSPCMCSSRGYAVSPRVPSCAPLAVMLADAGAARNPCSRTCGCWSPLSCCGTRGICPVAFRARTCPGLLRRGIHPAHLPNAHCPAPCPPWRRVLTWGGQ